MGFIISAKVFLVSVTIAVTTFFGDVPSHIVSAAKHTVMRDVTVKRLAENPTQPAPFRVIIESTPVEQTKAGEVMGLATAADDETSRQVSPTPAPQPATTPKPTPKPTPAPSPTPTKTPAPAPTATTTPAPTSTPSPAPTPTPFLPSPTPEPIPNPDFEVGTLLIGNNPSVATIGSTISFSIFVRDVLEAAVINKTVTFNVNGTAVNAATDANGNATLFFSLPAGFEGRYTVTVRLGSKHASFALDAVNQKPDLSLSTFAFTNAGFHVRLRNKLGDYVAGWRAKTFLRNGALHGDGITNELGVIEFLLPPREEGGHMYLCIEVVDVGRPPCSEW